MTQPIEYDVIIAGYGPAGQVAAASLGQAGHRVAVVERWPTAYGLPRLTHIDGETARIISACSDDVDHALRDSAPIPGAEFLDAEGKVVLYQDWSGNNSGFPAHLSMHQPDIEDAIDARVRALPNVQVLRGQEVVGLEQDQSGVTVTVAAWNRGDTDGETGDAPQELRAKYVFAADGARSTVRRLLGIDVEDFGTNERWLNFDTQVKRPLPEKFDRTAVTMDPARPYMFMPIGTKRQRFEIRVAEGEDAAAMEQPQVAWDWLRTKQNLGPDDVEIIRQMVYPFAARVARQWRSGRVLLGGDAAHIMPPYAGQGACSAMRDGRNAAWRLDVVLRGQAAESVLDTYEQERRGQYMPLLHLSVFLCGMINMTDPMAAEQRNAHLRQSPPPAAPFPAVTSGIVRRGADGTAAPLAGTLAPQGRVRLGSAEGRYDDVVGRGFQLVCTPDAADALTDEARDWFTGIGGTVALIGDGPGQVGDLDGVYGDYFTEHAVTAFLNRPDFVVYGAATTAVDISTLVEELHAHLGGDLPPAIVAEPQPQTAHAEA